MKNRTDLLFFGRSAAVRRAWTKIRRPPKAAVCVFDF